MSSTPKTIERPPLSPSHHSFSISRLSRTAATIASTPVMRAHAAIR
jgi:hypothetical protein